MKKVFVTTLFALVLCISNAFGLNYSNPESNNYVNEYGKLKLVGNQLCSEKGEPVQLRGWSTHGKNWQGSNFDDKNDFLGMKKHGANVARIAMYLISGGSEDLNWVKQCIQWTNELGMYCLVDWHILTPGNPNDGAYSNAPNFFSALSQWVVQNGYKNVLYEICNEPNENTEGTIYRPNVWKQIKEYSQKVLPKIEQNDPGAIVIIGTPQWDKALVFPMEDPVGEYNLGLMYSFHHYTCDQKQFLGLLSSAAAYIPLFVTEWGLSTDDGGENGQVCEDGGDNLLRICNGKNLGNQRISWCNWSWSADYRSSSALKGANNYDEWNLTQSGQYIRRQLMKGDIVETSQSSPYESAQKIYVADTSYIALEKYDKGGQENAYYEFDDTWIFDINNTCNAGGEFEHNGDCVDIGSTTEDGNGYLNLGYIVEGEWVKYTVDVEKPGDYFFETYTNNHTDQNVIAIAVNGKNGLVSEDGKDTYKALKLKTSGNGDSSGGYDVWGWTVPYAQYSNDKEKRYAVRFDKAGENTLAIAFMASCAGLGSLKFLPIEEPTGKKDINSFVDDSRVWSDKNGNIFFIASEKSLVKISNMQGVTVYDEEINANEVANVNLSNGVYIVSVIGNSKSLSKKVVINNL